MAWNRWRGLVNNGLKGYNRNIRNRNITTMYEKNKNRVSIYYEQKYSKKKKLNTELVCQIQQFIWKYFPWKRSLHCTALLLSNHACFFSGVIYEFHEATEHRLAMYFVILRLFELFFCIDQDCSTVECNLILCLYSRVLYKLLKLYTARP